MTESPYLTAPEAAALLRTSLKAVYNLVDRRQLPALRPGGQRRLLFRCGDVEAFAERSSRAPMVQLTIETEQEDDGRWFAEVVALPGVMAFGQTRNDAVRNTQVLALRVLADRLHQRELPATAFHVTPALEKSA